MEDHHGCLLLVGIWTAQLSTSLVQCAPLPYPDKVVLGEEALQLSLLVSVCALVALVLALFNCVNCCKEREINFKEFEDNFEDEIDFTPPAEDTPSMQSPAEVYTLAVPPVAMPGPPHLDLPRIADGSSGSRVARHSLSYIQEIGSGWFGKVLLSEIYIDPGACRAVVQELKANAGAKEQNDFLQQGDPYRVLQHPNLLQCLGQCVEAIPFLLVFEYCDLGDLKSYLAQQDWRYGNAELLQLQRMACEIAAGVTHLHKHNFLHSDLALRNCYLTADLTVKVGDYGIGPYRYKEDYVTTEEEQLVPLRWLAPELVGDLHGGIITAEQTKPGNVWALGVSLWELFENANQPYPHLSDREVLNHVIRDQQIKLFKPQLDLPYSERWYEVLQFCWLPPDKRATAEEVHRLLTYLRMQGQKDVEDDFEQRWSALRPNPCLRQSAVSASHSSFPILETLDEGGEPDEMLTVTETSRGLSFEYVWEGAKHDHYDNNNRSPLDAKLNYNSVFFPVPSQDIHAHFPPGGAGESLPQCITPPGQGIPGVLPVFEAHEAASGKDYYIQLEDQEESTTDSQELVARAEGPPESQHMLILHDSRVDESSTDADFFHGSLDSKDSFMPDSHTWSSSEHESPFNTNIFTEGDSKLDEPHSWRSGFLDRGVGVMGGSQSGGSSTHQIQSPAQGSGAGNPFLEGDGLRDTFLEECEAEDADVLRLLNTEKLADNFLFLRQNSLMKDSSDLSESNRNAISAGIDATTGTFANDRDRVLVCEDTEQPIVHVSHPDAEFLDFADSDFGELVQPLGIETLVPSKPCSDPLPVCSPPSNGKPVQQETPKAEIHTSLASTSLSIEAPSSDFPGSLAHGLSPSATPDITCAIAKTPILNETSPSSPNQTQHIGTNCTEPIVTISPEPIVLSTKDKDLSRSVSLTDSAVDVEKISASDADQPMLFTEDETSLTDGLSHDNTSLQVTEPYLDQISQDSLLDDSLASPLPITETSAETPDSLDSLDIHRLGVQEEEGEDEEGENLSTPVPGKLQPPYKTADSGYETENLESPEWNSQPVQDGSSREADPSALAEAASLPLVPPEIMVSEMENGHAEGVEEQDEQLEDVRASGEDPYVAAASYRDSAYFSDNELDVDRRPEEANGAAMLAEGQEPTVWHKGPAEAGPHLEAVERNAVGGNEFALQGQSSPLLDVSDPVIKESERNGMSATVIDSEVLEAERAPLSVVGQTDFQDEDESNNLCSSPMSSSDAAKDSSMHKRLDNKANTLTEGPPKSPLDNMVHAKLTRTFAGEISRRKEPDSEGRYLGRRDTALEDGREDGMEADEEDENSDDSDDERRAYQLHSDSEESEDDVEHPVPVIISDKSDAHLLKSLLKPTFLQVDDISATASRDSDSSRRAVSFFDDVTVYLFDQETPTKELGDHTLGSNNQVSEFSSPTPTAGYSNKFANSTESSTDEEGGGFEWEDDFSSDSSFLAKAVGDVAASKAPPPGASRYFSPPPQNRGGDSSWSSTASSYSRFSISPANMASFSLTHLTDSDIEQGGSSEDGEKD